MIIIEQGKVVAIIQEQENLVEVAVEYENGTNHAIGYREMVGKMEIGELILCNRTAVKLGLGTGGVDFILANLTSPCFFKAGPGHIMKLRYTPLQIAVEAVEEAARGLQHIFAEEASLAGLPVIVGSLHSMVAPSILGIHLINKKAKVAYIMSDGACLPLAFSRIVSLLKEKGLITATITYGHAFGGDYEAINIYTALLTAKYLVQADIAVVAMGPGIVGTGTIWGHTGLEQGEIANACGILNGQAILVPRLTFSDQRERHFGVSHHTLTMLEKICRTKALVALPLLSKEKEQIIYAKLEERGILEKYAFIIKDGKEAIHLAKKLQIPLRIMGRGEEQEGTYFEAAAAAGIAAAEQLRVKNN